ncbi:MAG: cob(I)yrinic acid a,c-diamide adenosyltransferase [Aggregatilineales bacterium]
MKIYTKTGDTGETSLFAGGRVPKHHLRVETYGTVDELNSIIGLIRAEDIPAAADTSLETIQNDLLIIGADLATPMEANPEWLVRLTADKVTPLENQIDTMEADLPQLQNFILPGGTRAAASAHVARTVCRRAERLCTALAENHEINPAVLQYLNRLSDFCFVLARWLNLQAGESETRWTVRD